MQTATLTVPYLFYDERVEADLVDALLEAVRLVHVHHLAVQMQQLRVAQFRTKDLIVKLLWGKKSFIQSVRHIYITGSNRDLTACLRTHNNDKKKKLY